MVELRCLLHVMLCSLLDWQPCRAKPLLVNVMVLLGSKVCGSVFRVRNTLLPHAVSHADPADSLRPGAGPR